MRASVPITHRTCHSRLARNRNIMGGHTNVAPATRTPTEHHTRTRQALEPHYRVVLYDDDVHNMYEVVRALLASVPEFDQARAAEIMLEAHLHGSAEVIVCPRERAALYRDRLESHGLTATIEPA